MRFFSELRRLLYKISYPPRKAYWFVFRPRTTGVKCLIRHGGKFLAIRNTYGRMHWTFPGGGVNRNEKPEEAVIREIREEVGIELERPTLMGSYSHNKEYKRDTVFCFYCAVSEDYFRIDGDEVLEAGWFARSEVPEPRSAVIREIFNLYDGFL